MPYHHFKEAAFPVTYQRAEVEIISQAILAGISVDVVAGPAAGKSNLLRFLAAQAKHLGLGERVLVYYELPADEQLARETVEKGMLAEFARVLGMSSPSLSSSDAADQALVSLIRTEIGGDNPQRSGLVLIVDAVEPIFGQPWAAAFWSTLRRLREAAKQDRFSCVLGRRWPVGVARGMAMPVPQFGELTELMHNTIFLGPLSEDDARDSLARHGDRMNHHFDQDDQCLLMSLSGRWPGLLKLAAQHLASIRQHTASNLVEPAAFLDIDPLIGGSNALTTTLIEIWAALTSEERLVLAWKAAGDPVPVSSRFREAEQQLVRRGLLLEGRPAGLWRPWLSKSGGLNALYEVFWSELPPPPHPARAYLWHAARRGQSQMVNQGSARLGDGPADIAVDIDAASEDDWREARKVLLASGLVWATSTSQPVGLESIAFPDDLGRFVRDQTDDECIRIDEATNRIWRGFRPCRLNRNFDTSPKIMQLIQYFLKHQGIILPNDRLYRAISAPDQLAVLLSQAEETLAEYRSMIDAIQDSRDDISKIMIDIRHVANNDSAQRREMLEKSQVALDFIDHLLKLLRQPGAIMDHQSSTPVEQVSLNALQQTVSRLRRMLGDTQEPHRYIQTEIGGYSFKECPRA